MRCQSCDKNDATTTVICDSCQSYYASIREGQYRDQEFELGEFQLRVTSWSSVSAPASKKAIREDKVVAKKRGFFGKKAPPEPEAEPEPPPDWKNRVFPSPNAGLSDVESGDAEAVVAAASITGAALVVGLHEELPVQSEQPQQTDENPYAMGSTNFSYDVAHGETDFAEPSIELASIEAPTVSAVTELPIEIDATPLLPLDVPPTAAENSSPVVSEILTLASLGELAQLAAPPSAKSSVEVPSRLEEALGSAPASQAPDVPSAELTSFFDSLVAPVATPAAPVEVVVPATSNEPSAELASFFDSLAAPHKPAVEESLRQEPIESPPGALAGFFESLTAPATPVPAEIAPSAAEVSTPSASTELSDFFASLSVTDSAPTAVTPSEAPPAVPEALIATPEAHIAVPEALLAGPEAHTSVPEALATVPEAQMALTAEHVEATATQPSMPEGLASFFDTLANPALDAPAFLAEPMPQPAHTPAAASPLPSDPPVNLDLNPSEELSSFFDSLAGPPLETATEQPSAAGELTNFFDHLEGPTVSALEPQTPVAETVPMAPVETKPAAIELSAFFESLTIPQPYKSSVVPAEVPRPTAASDANEPPEVVSAGNKNNPFSIAIDMGANTDAGIPGVRVVSADDLRPPTFGKPFSIDLGAPPQAPVARVKSPTDDLKRLHSQGGLAFVDGDEEAEDATGFGLLDGLAYEKKAPGQIAPQNNSGAPARGAFDDDGDTHKTIDL